MKQKLLVLVTFIVMGVMYVIPSTAQVTTSSIVGAVYDASNVGLAGATVKATHTPSGTMYHTTAQSGGLYNIQGMRIGGPYEIEFSFVGFNTEIITDVNLILGEPFSYNISLGEEKLTLSEVIVVGTKKSAFSSERTGAATNVNSQQMTSMPTISRSISDFTRLSPYSGANETFGGRDSRFNSINIDGASFNNSFGIGGNLPGGKAQPISLDAIEEIQVNIAPFDVRQANFTGAGINAVTRGGNNTFKGSAYTYYRGESFNGMRVNGTKLEGIEKTTTNIYGASLSGPIIKNKLFLFVNGEYEKSPTPGSAWKSTKYNAAGNMINEDDPNRSRTDERDLQEFSSILKSKYGYETGAYENYGKLDNSNYKILARLDWNISNNHKLMVRYNYVNSNNEMGPNRASGPNPRASSDRVGRNAMSFANTNYGFENTVSSLTAELNSTFGGGKFSNQLLATYTGIRDNRTSNSDIFPMIDIWNGNSDAYMSAGYELFSYNNGVNNDTYSFVDNFSYHIGRHTFTAGMSFDLMTFENSFMRYGTSYYRYADLAAFKADKPSAFALTYSLIEGDSKPSSDLTFGQLSAYIQDEYKPLDNLKLTLGLRFDMPMYMNDLIDNPAVSAQNFNNGEKLNLSEWPKTRVLVSPRIGFNWDVFSDKILKVRGGTGIFTGRIPFVFFTNQPTNSGMLQNTVELANTKENPAMVENFKFNPDPHHHLVNNTDGKLSMEAGKKLPGSVASSHRDFKMPQIWRSSLAFDYILPNEMMLTLEGMYTKDINAILQRNANMIDMPATTYTGPDNRPLYPGADNSRVVNTDNIKEAMVLDNTSRGYSYSLSTQLQMPISQNFNAMLAYTYSLAKDVSGNPGDQAASAWSNNLSVNGPNNLDMSYSQYLTPHKIVGSLSYSIKYAKHLESTFSVFYSGYHSGSFSYRYSNDFNKDGVNGDLMYMPKDATEIQFTDLKDKAGNVLFTANQQNNAFWAYVEQDDYLRNHKGEHAERNAVRMPWYNRFDFKFLQDISFLVGQSRNTLRFSIDVLNVGNLLNSDWGVSKQTVVSNGSLLSLAGVDAENKPIFNMNAVNSVLPTSTFKSTFTTSSTWSIQIGLRYIFN